MKTYAELLREQTNTVGAYVLARRDELLTLRRADDEAAKYGQPRSMTADEEVEFDYLNAILERSMRVARA